MAAHVLKIDELATRIAVHLLAIDPASTVALALTCRALEVPALRTLWETRESFRDLVMRVLSTDAWCFVFPHGADICLYELQRPLTTEELSRLQRHASWMRRLTVREWGLSTKLTRLVVPASAETPPALQLHLRELNWWLNETTAPYLQHFLSPHLTAIVITTNSFTQPGETVEPWDELPDEVLPMMRSAITMFPSSLQSLSIYLGDDQETRLTEEISAYVLGCGESLLDFSTNLVLSTQAIVHLMKLPNLCIWVTKQGPPRVTDLIRHGVPDGVTSLFPSLEKLDMRSEAALEWLSLLEATKKRTSPWIIAGGSLPILAYYHPTLPIDSSLVSRFLPFAGLVSLNLKTGMGCFMEPCVSQFTDQDVERLAIALPKLEALTLGWPCDSDTCPTTVRSLLFLSVHCTKLNYLNIHFRMASLQADMVDTLGYAYLQGLHSKPKCALESLVAGGMRLQSTEDIAVLSIGLLMIFPSLTKVVSTYPDWTQLEVMMKALGLLEGTPAMTENFMRCIKEVREAAENGVPARSADEMARFIAEALKRGMY